MSLELKSEGKICRCFLWSCVLLVMGCGLTSKKDQVAQTRQGIGIGQEVSLSGDAKTVQELRKNIPENVRVQNDLLKESLALLGEVKEHPHRHRDRFDRALRKVRGDFQKNERKKRDDFTKAERINRDRFLESLRRERERFTQRKRTRDALSEFHDDQEERRREYFAEEREARREFDSEMRAQASDFDDMLREREQEFRQELRIYTRNYEDLVASQRAEESRRQSAPDNTRYEPLKTEE